MPTKPVIAAPIFAQGMFPKQDCFSLSYVCLSLFVLLLDPITIDTLTVLSTGRMDLRWSVSFSFFLMKMKRKINYQT